jgi:hypothetical protein
MTLKPRRGDAPEVTARDRELRAGRRVAYWVVVSYHDGMELLAGRVSAPVRSQLVPMLKRARAASAEEYQARIAEVEL